MCSDELVFHPIPPGSHRCTLTGPRGEGILFFNFPPWDVPLVIPASRYPLSSLIAHRSYSPLIAGFGALIARLLLGVHESLRIFRPPLLTSGPWTTPGTAMTAASTSAPNSL